jgi:hypothetical protein
MTKKLEALFDLPDASEFNTEDAAAIEEQQQTIQEIDATIDKIDAALPTVKDLSAADGEMDELAKMATEKFEDLMDLGMNVEPRYAGVIFQTAGMLLGHAITAKQAKMDKKLRMVDLQLKKMRIDQVAAKEAAAAAAAGIQAPSMDGQGVVLDRNALLAQILGKVADDKDAKKA